MKDQPAPTHVMGAGDPKAADDRKAQQDAFRAKHRDAIQGNDTNERK